MSFGSKTKKKEVEEKEDVPAQTKKAATEPWNPEAKADSPRKRGALGISQTKEGVELRWVRLDSIDRRKMQGYVLAEPKDYDAQPDENGMVRRNELVLMEIPTEIYQQRRQDISKQTDTQKKAAKTEFERERDKASRESGHNLRDDKDRDEE